MEDRWFCLDPEEAAVSGLLPGGCVPSRPHFLDGRINIEDLTRVGGVELIRGRRKVNVTILLH